MTEKAILVPNNIIINMVTLSHQNDFSDWNSVFTDVNTVQIMFYLRKYNPNVDIFTITKNLSMSEGLVVEILDKLKKLHAVDYSEEKKNWTLTEQGRNVADCLYKFST